MLFTTLEFAGFTLVTLALFALFLRTGFYRVAIVILTLAGLYFYADWDVWLLPVVLGSIAFNLLVGSLIGANHQSPAGSKRARQVLLTAGISGNLLLLGYFKYFGWFLDVMQLDRGVLDLDIVLPLGISFYTFTQIAFLVDSYRGLVSDFNIIRYTLFVTFFPHLIAGPIIHHKEMMSQFRDVRWGPQLGGLAREGMALIAIGIAKKVFIADSLAPYVDAGYANPEALDVWSAWGTSLAYSMQLYFDFSGYSDMAVGLGLLFGVRLPQNFNSPYLAPSIQEFWRRWHMTLSRFLREYLYIPLGGNRKGKIVEYFAIFTTFTLGGIWHGAGLSFLIWGVLHGAGMVIERMLGAHRWARFRKTRILATFLFINTTWVFFRAGSASEALTVLQRMFDVRSLFGQSVTDVAASRLSWLGAGWEWLLDALPVGLVANIPALALVALALFITQLLPNSHSVAPKASRTALTPFVSAVVILFALLWAQATGQQVFLYFQF